MPEIWVVNASPCIVLAKVGHLDLLTALSSSILLPEPVASEILAGPVSDPARQALEGGWGQRVVVDEIPANVLRLRLDPGETSVVTVGLNRNDCMLVLDDDKARKAARSLGLPVIGTLGIVLRARKQGSIPSASAVLHDLEAVGLYLNDALLHEVLPTVGETWERT